MNHQEHAIRLGKLVGNLQSLEFGLRGVLAQGESSKASDAGSGLDALNFAVGSDVPETNITSYASLPRLVKLFNARANINGWDEVNVAVVELRDALAHGRTSSASPEFPLKLVKFDKPQNGRVRVTYSEIMDEAWFDRQMQMLRQAMNAIERATSP